MIKFGDLLKVLSYWNLNKSTLEALKQDIANLKYYHIGI